MKMRPFEKTDWYGFAGAEGNPMMSVEDVKIQYADGSSATGCAVLDDNGISLSMIIDGDGVDSYCFELFKNVSPRPWAELALEAMPNLLTEEQVTALFDLQAVRPPTERLLFSRLVYRHGEQTPTDISDIIGTYEVGQSLRIDIAAPGTGYTRYKVTRIDADGIWAVETSSTARELTAGDVR